ncbi:MAG: molecular chaperone TorD family protein, partial [Eubacterium sp.]|nr:molecular chaperone TorD family protein [Eubacterium sp.]
MNEKRYHLYCFLARCFEREVDDELLKKIGAMDLPKSEGVEGLKEKADLDDLAVDFAAVFLGAGQTSGNAAFPFESVYTSGKGLVMQEAWSQVKDIMASSGICLETDDKAIKEDHAACELLYMAYMIERDESISSQKEFFDAHIINWFSRFLADVEQYAKTPFYKALAVLTQDFIGAESKYLKEALKAEIDEASYRLTTKEMDSLIADLNKRYKVYAPTFVQGRRDDGKKEVRYAQVSSADEIVTDRPSDYSPKEIYYPIVQTLFYFKGENCS